MVMQAQQPQGISISDILQLAQLANANKKPEVPTTGDVPSTTNMTYTRDSGNPVENGKMVPVPQAKPDFNAAAQNAGIWNTIKGYFGG